MTVDPKLVCAEMRAGELLTALQAAVNGEARWRIKAAALLRDINDLVVPPEYHAALLEIDGRKRAAEILDDVCRDE